MTGLALTVVGAFGAIVGVWAVAGGYMLWQRSRYKETGYGIRVRGWDEGVFFVQQAWLIAADILENDEYDDALELVADGRCRVHFRRLGQPGRMANKQTVECEDPRALVHEFKHWMLWNVRGNPDSAHRNPDFQEAIEKAQRDRLPVLTGEMPWL